mgnify:CR=1 FL=1|jgi:hypothetical protein
MKYIKFMLVAIALMLTNFLSLSAQTTAAPGGPSVNLQATSYKFIKTVNGKEEAQPVQPLTITSAAYDLKTAVNYYEDEYDAYFVSFAIPDGQTLAAYDKGGKLIRTAERYELELLPTSLTAAVAKKYPGWTICKDVYLITYIKDRDNETKYRLVLENGTKRIKIKANDNGDLF